jgi:NAD(P)-dependent dehydrogenase (short-subunit alcohol dehydrogenase family)
MRVKRMTASKNQPRRITTSAATVKRHDDCKAPLDVGAAGGNQTSHGGSGLTVNELRFDGRVAVVTGAGRGVGRQYVQLLAQRGAAVVVNDFGVAPDGSGPSAVPAEQLAAEIAGAGGSAVADTHSVADKAGAEAVIRRALEEFGRIDVLIHNAGIVDGTFEQLAAVNLGAAFWLTEAAWGHMQAQRYGRILLTTSSAGLFGASNGATYGPIQSYGATKMGAFGLGRCLAVRGRPYDIRVNMVSPHAYTRLAAGLPPTPQAKFMETYAKPELVAPGSVFLVHETCPVSGEAFAVGAGRMARIFVGETVGYVDSELTVEKVAQNFAQVCDEAGYHVPADMSAIVDIYRRAVGAD